jgi:carbon monoxide dehydrogenase subunit G
MNKLQTWWLSTAHGSGCVLWFVTKGSTGWPKSTEKELHRKDKRRFEMIKIEHSLVINRPLEEVFDFIANPENTHLWAGAVRESKLTSEGPIGVGSTTTVVIEFLGRRIEQNNEITEFEPNSKSSFKTTSGPMPMVTSMTLKAVEGGTEVTNSATLEGAGLFKLAEPIFARLVNRQVEMDFANVKDLLEAQAFDSA